MAKRSDNLKSWLLRRTVFRLFIFFILAPIYHAYSAVRELIRHARRGWLPTDDPDYRFLFGLSTPEMERHWQEIFFPPADDPTPGSWMHRVKNVSHEHAKISPKLALRLAALWIVIGFLI
jgi:hypothetical protein